VAGATAATLLVSSSVAEAATRYFGASPAAAWLAGVLAPQLYAAPYFAAFAALARAIVRRRTGPVLARAQDGVATVLVADGPALDAITTCTRVGDLFAWLCVALALASAALPGRRSSAGS